MSGSRPRTVHATPAQWARIRERAEALGTATSPFVVACALHDETRESDAAASAQTQEGHRLALTEHMPEVEMSVLEALAFVQRCHQQVADERKRLVAMDGDYLA